MSFFTWLRRTPSACFSSKRCSHGRQRRSQLHLEHLEVRTVPSGATVSAKMQMIERTREIPVHVEFISSGAATINIHLAVQRQEQRMLPRPYVHTPGAPTSDPNYNAEFYGYPPPGGPVYYTNDDPQPPLWTYKLGRTLPEGDLTMYHASDFGGQDVLLLNSGNNRDWAG